MFCFQCGIAMADDARVCPSCGAPTPVAAVVPQTGQGAVPAGNAVPVGNVWPAAQFVPAQQTEDKAVISMVLGILALVSFSILTGIPAIILGRASRENIRASAGRLTGEGMATAGIVMGWVSVGLIGAIVLIIVVVLIFATAVATHS